MCKFNMQPVLRNSLEATDSMSGVIRLTQGVPGVSAADYGF